MEGPLRGRRCSADAVICHQGSIRAACLPPLPAIASLPPPSPAAPQEALLVLGLPSGRRYLGDLLSQYDRDGSTCIDFAEFRECVPWPC